MLATLRIAHFAVIDELEARFEPGFNAVTGETGAGKSILIDALHLLLGGRAQTDLVRTGHEDCTVEGLFEPLDVAAVDARLTEAGLPPCDSGQLLIRRVVHREGRSRAWVNGALATLGQLSQVMRGLVDVSSQHEHTSLLDVERHLDLLDAYAGLAPTIAEYREAYGAYREAERRLRSLRSDESERTRRADYLRFQLDEIDEIDPQPGEDETLKAERDRLAHSEKLREATWSAESLLYSANGSAAEQITSALAGLEKVAELDPALREHVETLKSAAVQVNDAARDLGRYARGVSGDPHRLEEIEERLEALRRLARKHGGDVASTLERRDAMREELSTLDGHDEQLARATAERGRRLAEARRLAAGLSDKRRSAALEFARTVVARLGDLGMKHTVLELRLSLLDGNAEDEEGSSADDSSDGGPRIDPRGQDRGEIVFSPNPGEEPRPLAKIASGGELSRVMLAIKRVLSEQDPVETYVFDEVDAGIGGATGEVIGRMIREVGRERQVLCITHLPQIAAYAEAHFTVAKAIRDGRTHSELLRLSDPDVRRSEVARMLSGHVTDASREHADELIARGEALSAKKPRKRSA